MTKLLFALILLTAGFAGCTEPTAPVQPPTTVPNEGGAIEPANATFRFEGTIAAGVGVQDGGCESGAIVVEGANAVHDLPVPNGTATVNATLEATGVAPPELRLCAYTDKETYSLTGVPPLQMEIPGAGVTKVRFQILPNNQSPVPSARVAYTLQGTLTTI